MRQPVYRSLLAVVGLAATLAAQAELQHRYSFATDVSDSVGNAHGTTEGSAFVSPGYLILDGTSGTYANLPSGLIEGYSELTVEIWATVFPGSSAWTRLFDFGAISGGNGRDYVMLTPQSGPGDTRIGIAAADPGYNNEQTVNAPGTLNTGVPFHIAAVLAPERGWGAIYIDGVPRAWRTDLTILLSDVDPESCFIGRSLYAPDGWLNAWIEEFRVHNNARTSAEIAASYQGGANNPVYDPGTATALALVVPQMRVGGQAIPEVTVTFSGAGAARLTPAEVILTSLSPDVVGVREDGMLMGIAAGTATIRAEYNGVSGTANVTVQAVPAVLEHRYSFNEPAGATQVNDSVGGKHGFVYPDSQGLDKVTLGTGQAVFPGGGSYLDGGYIDLPDYMISTKTNVTLEVWVTWNGPAASSWQRIFDFGSSQKGSNPHTPGNGLGGFFLTPRNGANAQVRFIAEGENFVGTQELDGGAMLPVGQESHVVCIYAPDNQVSQLWVNGVLVSTRGAPFALSQVNDVNCWLGLAMWNDPPLNGSINEFRIYEGALSELEIALRRQAGPDAVPGDPGLLQAVEVEAPALLLGNPVPVPASLKADFQNLQDLEISGLTGSTFSSSDTSVFTVTGTGMLLPVGVGEAELTGNYGGLSASTTVRVLAPTALALEVPSPLLAGGPILNAVLTATYDGATANATTFSGVTFTSGTESVATVTAAGVVLPQRPGNSILTATYGGLSASFPLQVLLPDAHEQATLIHRYSFGEAVGTTTVTDSVGTADGQLVNPSADSAFTGTGRLRLQGGTWDGAVQSGYVNLPNGLVSSLPSLSIEGWVRWAGPAGSSWQRIFDFGRNSANDGFGNFVEDQYANPGLSYMFLTPRSGDNTFRFAIKQGDGAELPQLNAAPLPVGIDVHFAVVYDTAAGAVRLFVNGARVATGPLTHPLSVLEDLNVYLGRSQWTDPYFAGEFDEFRIYRGTFFDDQVLAGYVAGPDTLPDLTPVPSLGAGVEDGQLVLAWPEGVTGFVLEKGAAVDGSIWDPVNGVVNNRVTVPMSEDTEFFRLRKP
jgi:hypothetical protein